jgi:hypothetical protein
VAVDTANALSRTGQTAILFTEPGVGHVPPPLDLVATQSANFYYLALDLVHGPQ